MPWSVLLRNSQNDISFFPFLELIKQWTAVDITAQQQSQMGRTFHFAMDPMIKGGQSCVLQIGIKSGSNGKFVTVSRQFSVGWWRLGDFWPVTYSYYHLPNGWFQFFCRFIIIIQYKRSNFFSTTEITLGMEFCHTSTITSNTSTNGYCWWIMIIDHICFISYNFTNIFLQFLIF